MKTKWMFAFLMMGTLLLSACGDDNKTPGKEDPNVEQPDSNNPSTPDQPSTPDSPTTETAMSPTEQKEKLDVIARNFMSQVDSKDFNNLSDFGHGLNEKYENHDWDVIGDWAENIFKSLKTPLNQSDSSVDPDYPNYTYYYTYYQTVILASNYKSHFEANNRSWTRTNADDLQFIFDDKDGKECVLKVLTSDNVKQVHVATLDEWTGYTSDEINGKYYYKEYYDRNNLIVGIPEEVKVTLTRAGDAAPIMDVDVKIDLSSIQGNEFDLSKSSITVSTTVKLNNGYVIDLSQVSYTPTKAKVQFSLSKNDMTLVTLAAASDLKDLPETNVSDFSKEDFSDDDFENANATNAYAKVDIMGKAQVQAKLKDVRKFVNLLDEAGEYEENETKFKSCVAQANELLEGSLFYDGTNTQQAKVRLESIPDNYGGNQYWEMEPVLEFFDGSTYSTFEAFFNDKDFKTVIDQFDDLVDAYTKLIEK